MKVIKPFGYSYETRDGLACTHCYGTDETWVQLDPGEFVARWETCACRERDASGNYEPEQDCWKCDGKGSYAVPVEVEK